VIASKETFEAPAALSPGDGLCAGAELAPKTMAAIRRKVALEGCKWDTQVGDVATLASFPIVMKRRVWDQLARWAEQLSAEMLWAEEQISRQPKALARLGLPAPLFQVLTQDLPLTPGAGRVIRFDFHPTTEGWRVSEANSDVPGGFSEGSFFTDLMAKEAGSLSPAGNPGATWADALGSRLRGNPVVVLLSASGYMEDHQVNSFLAGQLRQRGCSTHLAKPEQIRWRDGEAHLETAWYRGRVDAIVRFYQAEWLARLPRETGWRHFFRGGKTPVANYGLAAITESKRFPLLCEPSKFPAWHSLLPETRDPREVDWARDQEWLLKPALCNTGEAVCIRESMAPAQWLRTWLDARLRPGNWIAQKRFQSVPVATPVGPRHVCVGVYTVDGRAAGAYARISEKTVIDFSAVDAALLIDNDY
jgi:glutathionylspermidine synthase